ncbi:MULTISPECIES: hypothetical protein [unclassified Variovorax]|uniref:hypothetical protein n=1 Tax=unclassified Variovorax TaxID=663243 RepID=UPI00180D9999|nr:MULTISPECIES: hypothetical protein [unclassified Variovorax]MBB3182194.1 hypothetical protein [Variovorax sp. Sphag1AA]
MPNPMSQLRNIALTVQELEEGEFYWVLLEATDYEMDDALPYLPIEAATDPYVTYSNALVAGVAAIRKLFGKDGPRS